MVAPITFVSDNNTTGQSLGFTTSTPISFYGQAVTAQRAAAAQATSLVGTASSADVNSDMKAALIEVMNTLAALGAWKGSA